MNFIRRLILLILLVTGLLLQGCSAVRLGYNHADTLARWWIDQYLDMTPEQDALSRERLARFHAWHRKTQLPDYLAATRQAQQLIAGQPTVADVLMLVDEIIRLGWTMGVQAIPDIADFLSTVTPEQIESMAARFSKNNAEYAKKAQLADDDSGQRAALHKLVLERTEYWFGSFSSEQVAALRLLVDGQTVGSRFWYDERLRRQREWLEVVRLVQRDRPPREHIIQMLHDYATRFELPSNPLRLVQEQALRRNAAELFVAIHAMASPEQRAHALHKLSDLMRDFAELSRED